MTPPRQLLAGPLLALALAGCGATSSAAAPSAPAATSGSTPPPAAAGPASTTASPLGSQPATLDALRAAQARRPVSVLVPGVATAAPVEARTTNPVSGGLDLPDGPAKVAWWASGSAPGDGTGSVVLAAHVSYNGQTGPFTRLASVPPGTEVIVTSADGTARRYAVQSIRNAPKTALDRGELFRTTGKPALVLVTCGGAYDRTTHSFADNVVVTATPV